MAAQPLKLPEGISIAQAEEWMKTYLEAEGSYEGFAGIDEAGRGPLAGPVVAACVQFYPQAPEELLKSLRDSKKLTEKKREALFDPVKKWAYRWGIGLATSAEIDEINILQATFLAMSRAVESAKLTSNTLCLIDGNQLNARILNPQFTLVKGDDRVASIAAASILAKVYRDRMMDELDLLYPHYDWKKNKGYGSKSHRQALVEFGSTKEHRKTFKWKAP